MLGLMDGPPSRDPKRVTEGTVLRGKRVLVGDDDGEWVGDLRAVDDPYWLDHVPGSPAYRWKVTSDPPDGARATDAVLTVSVSTEADWYDWARTRRRPEIREYPAYRVWVE